MYDILRVSHVKTISNKNYFIVRRPELLKIKELRCAKNYFYRFLRQFLLENV